MNTLLDYVFKVSAVTPTPEASTGFLKQACVVCKPKEGVEAGSITACVSQTAIAALTDNVEAQQLLNAGMAKVFILLADDLDLVSALEDVSDFFTVLISSDFSDAEILGEGSEVSIDEVKATVKIQDILYTAVLDGEDGNDITIVYTDALDKDDGSATVAVDGNEITVDIETGVTTAQTIAAAILASEAASDLVTAAVDEGDEEDTQVVFTPAVSLAGGVDEEIDEITGGLDVGQFKGVVGLFSNNIQNVSSYASNENKVGFYGSGVQKAKNMIYAFGKLLSNALNWANQQYISMPVSDGVTTLGEAESFFDDKVSFVISDDEFGNRLGLFAVGGKAIVAPYIKRNLEINLQSEALSFISGNQPSYTKKYATLLENALNDVIQSYIDRQWIEAGTVEVKLEQDNFVASGYINIAEPKALWRVFAEMKQTL
jgi:hypothetical protein